MDNIRHLTNITSKEIISPFDQDYNDLFQKNIQHQQYLLQLEKEQDDKNSQLIYNLKSSMTAVYSSILVSSSLILATIPIKKRQTHLFQHRLVRTVPSKMIMQNYHLRNYPTLLGFNKKFLLTSMYFIPLFLLKFATIQNSRDHIFTNEFGLDSFLAGFAAGVSEAIFVIQPFEKVQQQIQHHKIYGQNTLSIVYQYHKQKGIFSMYRGCAPTIFKQGMLVGINILSLEEFLKFQTQHVNFLPEPVRVINSAIITSVLTSLLQQPFTRIKEKMYGKDHQKYKNILDCIKKVYKYEGGILEFYRGMSIRTTFCQYILPTTVTLILYSFFSDRIKKLFGQQTNYQRYQQTNNQHKEEKQHKIVYSKQQQ